MATSRITPVYDELLDYLVGKATPAEILAFRPSPTAQERADYLTDKNKEGALTPEEADELQQLLELDAFVSTLKARALAALNTP